MDKLLNCGTGKDLDLAICLAQYQNIDGNVHGIHYKKITSMLRMSHSQFYKSLKHLEKINVVEIDWRNNGNGHGWGMWSVKFIDNDYSSKNYKKDPYFNVNHKVLHEPQFLSLALNEKKIVLRIMRVMNFNARDGKKDILLHIDTLMRWVNRSRRAVVGMIKNLSVLSHFMTITLDGNNIIIPTGPGFNLSERRSTSEESTKITHAVNHVINKMKYSIKSGTVQEYFDKISRTIVHVGPHQTIADICAVFQRFKIKGFDRIVLIVSQSLRECGHLSPRHITHLIKESRKTSAETSISTFAQKA